MISGVKRAFFLLFLFMFIAGCVRASLQPAETGLNVLPGRLQAWVDAPLDGMVFILPVQYEIVCHGPDPGGVQSLEFSVSEQVLATQSNPDPSQTLFTAPVAWQPTEAGVYVIQCRTENSAGEWSAYASVSVTIVETDLPPMPTDTARPTDTVTPISVVMLFTPSVSTDRFEYKKDCVPDPGQVTINVTVSDPSPVSAVYLFYHLRNQSGSEETQWNNETMTPLGEGQYSLTIAWDDFPDLSIISGSKLSSWFIYQFIAQDGEGDILARSSVYSDIAFVPCE